MDQHLAQVRAPAKPNSKGITIARSVPSFTFLLTPFVRLLRLALVPMAEPSSSGDQLADGGFLEKVLPELATPDEMARASTSRIPPENLQASASGGS